MDQFILLEETLGFRFQNRDLFRESMTHKSYSAEHSLNYDNQRLELLGDAVVQIILTTFLYAKYPDCQEGQLTKLRSALANQDSLARFARHISLGNYLRLGRGEIESHGAERDSTLSDAFEALLGAVYLDNGPAVADQLLLRIIRELDIDPQKLLLELNPKGALQEYTQSKGMKVPTYQILSVSGPDHEPSYEVQVSIQDTPLTSASAHSRKQAESIAASKALDLLKSKESN